MATSRKVSAIPKKANPGRPGDAKPTGLVQSAYSGTAIQQWSFQSLADQLGIYEVSPASKTASTIWPASGGSTDGLAVQAITYNTNDSQKWFITPL